MPAKQERGFATSGAEKCSTPNLIAETKMKSLMAMATVVLMSTTCFAGEEWKPRLALQLYSLRDRSFIDAVKTAKNWASSMSRPIRVKSSEEI